jgi:hypothetical protein
MCGMCARRVTGSGDCCARRTIVEVRDDTSSDGRMLLRQSMCAPAVFLGRGGASVWGLFFILFYLLIETGLGLAPARVSRNSFRYILGWVELRNFDEICREGIAGGAGRLHLQPLHLPLYRCGQQQLQHAHAIHHASKGVLGSRLRGERGWGVGRARVGAGVSVPRCWCEFEKFWKKLKRNRTEFLEICSK